MIGNILLSLAVAAMTVATPGSQSLDGKWNLTYWRQPAVPVHSPSDMERMQTRTISADVPGNVELDLLREGLIDDPMIGGNVNKLRSWEGCQWCYSRSFEAPQLSEGQKLQLWFGGIDCLANVWVNDSFVGKAENMMIEHAFDITEAVHPGTNDVKVILRSPVLEGQERLVGAFSVKTLYGGEEVYVRKAPHMFGWDILPRLVSAGLWRSVELRVLNPVRLRDVRWMVPKLDTLAKKADVCADVQLSMPIEQRDGATARAFLRRNGRIVTSYERKVISAVFRVHLRVDDAQMWWPRGYGDQALYEAVVEIVGKDGTVLDRDCRKIGLRTVELELDPVNLPEKPGKFLFKVNGEPIFIHGTNWVPMDALHSRDPQHTDRMLEMAADLNVNMIRCWGGNVYEDHHFFDLCDSLGIMVWQDFAMACDFYPQTDDFAKAIDEEVTSVVVKLRNHPSLALWAGNNENDVSSHWDWMDVNPDRDRISREVIPRVLYEYDPTRPYIPSSPYCADEIYQLGWKMEFLSEDHLWGPRGYYKDDYYMGAKCLFVSEIGYHGCPNVESLEKMFTPEGLYPWTGDFVWNEEWLTKSVREFEASGNTHTRNDLMLNQIRLLWGDIPTRLEDFSFASQCVQAEAMKYFLEVWRSRKFSEKTGMIWWNLRDGWPVISDAVVDYYYGKKLAYYYLRNVQRDVCVMITDHLGEGLPLVAVNDTRREVEGEVKVTDIGSGRKVFRSTFSVPRNGRTVVTSLPKPSGKGIYLIEYEINGEKLKNHYLYGEPTFDISRYKALMKKAGLYGF